MSAVKSQNITMFKYVEVLVFLFIFVASYC
jgi:hypothetical protein